MTTKESLVTVRARTVVNPGQPNQLPVHPRLEQKPVSRRITVAAGMKERPKRETRTIVEPRKRTGAVDVRREPGEYWMDKGWHKDGMTYTGFFSADGVRCSGTIVWGNRGLKDCLISGPPDALWKHAHAICFQHIGDNVFRVHFSTEPHTVDAAIITVEEILCEAAHKNGKRRKR